MWIFNLSLSCQTVLSPVWASTQGLSLAGLLCLCGLVPDTASMISLASGSCIASLQSFRNELQTVASCDFKIQTQFLWATKSKLLACQISHTPVPSKPTRETAEKGFAPVLLNINSSFLPLSTQRDRGLTNPLSVSFAA